MILIKIVRLPLSLKIRELLHQAIDLGLHVIALLLPGKRDRRRASLLLELVFICTYVDSLNLLLENRINACNLLRLSFAVALELGDRLRPLDALVSFAHNRLLLSVLNGIIRPRFQDRFLGRNFL